MKTRSLESRGSLSSYRQPLRSAMKRIFAAPFFSTLIALGPQEPRPRRWTWEYVLYVSLLMVLDNGASRKDRFAHARQAVVEMFPGRKRPGQTYQGYVKASRRLQRQQRRALHHQLCCHPRQAAGSFWQRDGWLAFAADSTRVGVPRTARNEQAFGCAGKKKTGPQLLLTSLYHLGTGLPWAWQIGAGTAAEQTHLRQMVGSLPSGALLVADAGFTSYALLQLLLARHVEVLVRMGSNRTLLTGLEDARVQTDGEIVWLWPLAHQAQCPPLRLRLVRLEQANHAPMYLVTSVREEQVLTERQIGQFYRLRWGQEVFHRSFKRTLQQYQMRSGSPEEARRELDWAVLGYLLLGLWTVEALVRAHHDPRTWSVAESLRVVRGVMPPGGRPGRRGRLSLLLSGAVKDR